MSALMSRLDPRRFTSRLHRRERAPRSLSRAGHRLPGLLDHLEERTLLSDVPVMLKDVNSILTNIAPHDLVEFQDSLYFLHRNGLWTTDGTEAGTVLVKDIELPDNDSRPMGLVAMESRLYFYVGPFNEPHDNHILWTSDGTEAGTENLDVVYGYPKKEFVQAGSLVFFGSGETDGGPRHIWRTDGTPDGTVHIVESFEDWDNRVAVLGDTLYFLGWDSLREYDEVQGDFVTAVSLLWGNDLRDLTSTGDTLYFANDDYLAGVGSELWRSDGTQAGTALVKDIRPGPEGADIREITSVGDLVFFAADDGTTGEELWRSDGTEAGTFSLGDLNPGSASSNPRNVTSGGQYVYFTADDGVNGRELWKTDGTPEGTMRVKDIRPGAASSTPTQLTWTGETLYFTADDGIHGQELWRTDGTEAGTTLVEDISPGPGSVSPRELTWAGNILYFTADDGIHGREVWQTDGLPTGARMIVDLEHGTRPSNAMLYAEFNGFTYFVADDGIHGRELWRTDGTEAGTELWMDIVPGAGHSFGTYLDTDPRPKWVATNQALYFVADDGVHGSELWKTDGTQAGTNLVRDINPGSAGANVQELMAFGGFLYFQANDGVHGSELWKTDGTQAGTNLVRDINPGSASSAAQRLTVVGETLYFQATDGVSGFELWKTDGSSAGTILVKDVNPGPASSAPSTGSRVMAALGDVLYFQATDGVSGFELWKTDGTEAGTALVRDINPGPASSVPQELAVFDEAVYFSANFGVIGQELWRTDGTEDGTLLVKDISNSAGGSRPTELTVMGNSLYFTALSVNTTMSFYHDAFGLWKTDGTESGTIQLQEYLEGVYNWNWLPFLKYPTEYTVIDENLYFTVSDGYYVSELWKSDGTIEGTIQIANLYPEAPGPGALTPRLNPAFLTASENGTALYFTGSDGLHGFEPWILRPNLAPTADIGGPYTVDEGGTVILDASGSSDPNSEDVLSYAWDFNGDGVYDDAIGPSPTFSAVGLDGPATVLVGLKVTDPGGLEDVATATVTIVNAAPIVDAGSNAVIAAGSPFARIVRILDASPTDTVVATVDYGDGTIVTGLVPEPGGSLTLANDYATGRYTVTISATDSDGDTGSDTIEVAVLTTTLVQVIDDGEAGFSLAGTWSISALGGFQGDSLFRLRGTADDTASWTFVATPGIAYQVAVTYPAHPTSTTAAAFTILDGVTPVAAATVNQRLTPDDFMADGVGWRTVGVPVLAISDTLTVVLSGLGVDGAVRADAVRIDVVNAPVIQVVDNRDPLFHTGERWWVSELGGFAGESLYYYQGTAEQSATWTFHVIPGRSYRVYTTYPSHPTSSTMAPFTILDGVTPIGAEGINQRLDPDDLFADGTYWEQIDGYVTPLGNILRVHLSGLGVDGVVRADAVRIEQVPNVIDDGDAGFATTGTWLASSLGGFEGDSLYAHNGTEADTASWIFEVTRGQPYRVYATYPVDPGSTTSAVYTILDGTNVAGTAALNQRLAPDDLAVEGLGWEQLGGVVIPLGDTLTVVLSGLGVDGVVRADAVRIELGPPRDFSIVDDGDPAFEIAGPWQVSRLGGYQGDSLFNDTNSAESTATWMFTVTPGEVYRVYVTYPAYWTSSTAAAFTILDGPLAVAQQAINQRIAPDDLFAGGVFWERLGGEITTMSATLTVRLTGDGVDGVVRADAVRIERISLGDGIGMGGFEVRSIAGRAWDQGSASLPVPVPAMTASQSVTNSDWSHRPWDSFELVRKQSGLAETPSVMFTDRASPETGGWLGTRFRTGRGSYR